MYRGNARKYWPLTLLVAATVLLQGCSFGSMDAVPETESNEIPAAENLLKYNPSLSPAFAEPWPTDVTRQELVDTALHKSFTFFAGSKAESCSVKTDVYITKDTLPGHVEIVDTVANTMNLLFCEHLESDLTLVAGDYLFLKQTVASEKLPKDEFDGICGYELDPSQYNRTGCASKGVAWAGVPFGTSRRGTLITERHAVSLVAHELFHLVQDSIDPGQSGHHGGSGKDFYRPVWWIEGGGEFVGRLIPRYLEVQDYGFAPLPSDSYGAMPPLEPFSDLSSFENWDTGPVGSNGHYYAGQLALEYIVASKGMEPVITLLMRLGDGESFNPAFEEVIGISVEDFYKKFAELHDNLIAK